MAEAADTTELFRPDQLPDIFEHPEVQALPFEERSKVLEKGIAEASDWMARNGGWTPDTWRDYGTAVSKLRTNMADTETFTEKSKWAAETAGNMAADVVRAGEATAFDLSARDQFGEWRVPLSSVVPMVGQGFKKAGSSFGALVGNVSRSEQDEALETELSTFRKELDEGSFPFDGEKFGNWMQERNAALVSRQRDYYRAIESGKEPEEIDAYALANGLQAPRNARLVAEYLRTRSPDAWKQLRTNLIELPRHAEADAEQSRILSESDTVRAMNSMLEGSEGTQGGSVGEEALRGAGDPVNAASMVLPFLQAAKAAKAGSVFTNLAKGMVTAQALGAAGLAIENPGAQLDDYWSNAKVQFVGALGMEAAGLAAGRLLPGGKVETPQKATETREGALVVDEATAPTNATAEAQGTPTQDVSTAELERQRAIIAQREQMDAPTVVLPKEELPGKVAADAEAAARVEQSIQASEAQRAAMDTAAEQRVAAEQEVLSAASEAVPEQRTQSEVVVTSPEVQEPSKGRLRAVERTLVTQGVENEVAAQLAPELAKRLPEGQGMETLMDGVMAEFERMGGVFPNSVTKRYLEDQRAYEAQGYTPEEAKTHAENSVIANRADVDAVHQGNRALLPMLRDAPVFAGEKMVAEVPRRASSDGVSAMPASAMPRGAGPATPTPLPSHHSHGATPAVAAPGVTWSGQRHTLHGIRKHLLQSVGLPAVGVGRIKRALGMYFRKPEAVRLVSINDVPVLAHEVGHAIHAREFTADRGASGIFHDWGGQYDGELMALGKPTSKPSYTPEQVRKEGVAEFTRLWLTNPAAARAQAPAFAAHWSSELAKRNPEMWAGIEESQRRIQDFMAMPQMEKAMAQMVFDPEAEKPRRSMSEWLRGAYAGWVNTLQPAFDVVRDIARRDPALSPQAQHVEALMENHRGGWASRSHGDLFLNQTNLHGQRVGPSLKAILSDIKPHEHQEFSTYLALKRAQEIENSGRRSGFEHAKLSKADMVKLDQRFERTRQKVLKFQDNVLQMMQDSGVLSPEAVKAMRTANKDYVPFYRMYEQVNNMSFGPEGSRNAGGYVDLRSGIQRLKGSDRAIVDPLQSVMKNAYMFRKLAEQNRIADQFFDLVESFQGHGEWGQGVAQKKAPSKVTHDEVVKKLVEQKVIRDASDLPVGADLALTIWRAVSKPDSKTGEVVFFRNGKEQHWELKDGALMQALKTADADAVRLGKFIGPTAMKLATLPTRIKRFGATGGPWFAIPNWFRDQITAGIQSKSGYVPFWDGFRGALDVLQKGPMYQRFVEAGGAFHGYTTHTQMFRNLLEDVLPKEPMVRRQIRELMEVRNVSQGLRAAKSLVREAGALLSGPGNVLEEATRVGEFMRSVEKGASDMVAANAAKVVSMNFARAGQYSRAFNMINSFFNAKVQGWDQMIRMHADPKTRGRVALNALMYITTPSVLLWALGKDDEKIQKLPEWRKNLFWNINLEPMARALGRKDGFVLSVPKPFLLGTIYGTMVERSLDWASERDPNGVKKAVKQLYDQEVDLIDTFTNIDAIKPLLEAQWNHDAWRNKEIVPDAMQSLPAPQQHNIFTSQTAKVIGKFTGHSPMVIDHLINGYFASAGKWGVGALDWGMAKLGVSDVPPMPEKDLMEMVILNRFAGSPYESNAYVERFYNAAKDMEGKMRVFRKESDQMTTAEQAGWWKENGDEILYYQQGATEVRRMLKHLSEINGAMKDVYASRTVSPQAKRERLMELSRQRNASAEQGFKRLFPEKVRRRFY